MAPVTVSINTSQGNLGAMFQNDAGCILISSIQKGGWFHGTDICDGYEIISVNGSPCNGMSPGDVEQLLSSANGTVTVIADDPMDTQRRRAIQL